MSTPAGPDPVASDAAVYGAVQVLAEHLTRALSDDVTAGAGLLTRDRSDELRRLALRMARTVDAYGTPARDVLAAVEADPAVIALLDR